MSSGLKLRLRTAHLSGGGSPGGGGAVGEAIPSQFFGIHIGDATPTTIWGDYSASAAAAYRQTPWPEIGAGTLRLWDGNGCTWRNIERSKGVYTWTRFDYYLGLCVAHGAKPMVVIGNGPDWATTQPGAQPGLYVGYNPYPPALDADWQDWCTALATHMVAQGFPGAIYEIWNEVNALWAGGFSGTTARLVELTQLAQAAVKAVDPTAIILTPNFTGGEGIIGSSGNTLPALDKFIAAGGMAYVDGVSIHGYNSLAPWPRPEGLIAHATNIKNLLRSTGYAEKPVYNTEWGFGLWSEGAPGTGPFHSTISPNVPAGATPAPDAMPEAKAASYVTRMILLCWLVGFKSHCHYSLDGFNWASIEMCDEADRATLKRPGVAFAYAAQLLTGGYLSGLARDVYAGVEYYRATFTTASGRFGRVYWCDDVKALNVPLSGIVELRDNVGMALAAGATVPVTGQPCFAFLS